MYKAKIGHFVSFDERVNFFRCYIDDKTMKEVTGIKFDNFIIDIETGNYYPIIKRNEKGYIDQRQDLELDLDYALYVEKVDKKNITFNEYKKCADAKIKALLKVKELEKEKTKSKVLKLEK